MKKDVMVVDDEPQVLLSVKKILNHAGFHVITTDSGEACLRELKNGFQGLILMDIMMPEMDGWDTIENIINEGYTKGNIICMLTGKEQPDHRMDEMKEYILDYMTKPFDPSELVKIVKQYLSYLS